jgi:hypothetical protein
MVTDQSRGPCRMAAQTYAVSTGWGTSAEAVDVPGCLLTRGVTGMLEINSALMPRSDTGLEDRQGLEDTVPLLRD